MILYDELKFAMVFVLLAIAIFKCYEVYKFVKEVI